jgi:hypothetical protein
MRRWYGVVMLAAVVLLMSVQAGIAAEQKVQFKVPGVV